MPSRLFQSSAYSVQANSYIFRYDPAKPILIHFRDRTQAELRGGCALPESEFREVDADSIRA
jgi:hypothetical protein